MTFLEICQRLRQEVGAAGSGPASVSGQQGEYARFVGWAQQSWREIQISRERWRFMWAEASVPVSPDFLVYSPPNDLREWDADSLACNGLPLEALPWVDFRRRHPQSSAGAVPSVITQKPDGTLVLDTFPSQEGEITFEYWRTPQVLTAGGDVPRLPESYHMVIVYRAMLHYALYENAPEMVQAARLGEDRILAQMAVTELPVISLGGPLA